jgi:hypothetical protein
MPEDLLEEDLLRSIDEIDAQIKKFRQQVRGVLAAAQAADGIPELSNRDDGGSG